MPLEAKPGKGMAERRGQNPRAETGKPEPNCNNNFTLITAAFKAFVHKPSYFWTAHLLPCLRQGALSDGSFGV